MDKTYVESMSQAERDVYEKCGGYVPSLYWIEIDKKNNRVHCNQHGITLRDWFAGMALGHNSLCSGPGSKIAKECYYVADAMLKEREKETEALPDE